MREALRLALVAGVFLSGTTVEAKTKPTPQEIIKRFSEKESEFKKTFAQYTYTQHILFQVLSRAGRVREQREMVVEIYFTKDGERQEKILRDRGRLRSVRVSQEDIDDALNVQPFALTAEDLPKYKIKYKGKARVDELDTYMFDVKPRKIRKRKRYFKGRIWVDDEDLQIVRTIGKAVPDYSNNKFPEFETLREQIDGEHWFPTWTEADDVLEFRNKDVRVRELITYQKFKKFEVGTSIKYGPAPENKGKDADSKNSEVIEDAEDKEDTEDTDFGREEN